MTGPWRVLLVDPDEERRRRWRIALGDDARFRLAGEMSTGQEAAEALLKTRVDLAFLADPLPDLPGMTMLQALPPRRWPLLVLCTPEGASTAEGSEPSGVNALRVTCDGTGFGGALDHAAQLLKEPDSEQRALLESALEEDAEETTLEKIPVRHNDKVEVIPLERVEWIGSAGNYVELHHEGRRHLIRSPLKNIAARLDPKRFVRIHRCTVVNVNRVRDLEPTPQGDWKLRLDTGDQLRLSRRFRQALDRLPQMRRGSEAAGS